MTQPVPTPATDGHAYWNGEGGDIWVRNMDRTDANLVSMTAALMSRAAPLQGECVLDVGCGGGTTSRALAAQVAPDGDVLAVDISATILRVAQERHGTVANLRFVQADAGTADLDAQRFDLVFSRFGVMFFADPVAAFTNLRRALKPTGRLAFMCWRGMKENAWVAEPMAAAIAALGEEHRPAPPADPRAPGPFAFADAQYTKEILRQAGFAGVEVERLDDSMRLDDVETALAYLKRMGPISQALPKVSEEQVQAMDDAMRVALGRYATATRLDLPSATWLVTATA